MKLSEIADWHDAVKNEWAGTVEGVFHAHAAVTLREREAKLKIATEALENTDYMLKCIGHSMPHVNQALARIKEVG